MENDGAWLCGQQVPENIQCYEGCEAGYGNNITGDDIENNALIDQSMAGTYFRAFWEKQYNGLIE